MGAARTVSLVEPCAELVKDGRPDATVDLVIGQRFDQLRPTMEARRIINQLNEWAAGHPPEQGGLQAQNPEMLKLDPNSLAAARNVTC